MCLAQSVDCVILETVVRLPESRVSIVAVRDWAVCKWSSWCWCTLLIQIAERELLTWCKKCDTGWSLLCNSEDWWSAADQNRLTQTVHIQSTFRDDGIESVNVVSSIVNNANRTIWLEQLVLALDNVTIANFMLRFYVTGHIIGHTIIVRVWRIGMLQNAIEKSMSFDDLSISILWRNGGNTYTQIDAIQWISSGAHNAGDNNAQNDLNEFKFCN